MIPIIHRYCKKYLLLFTKYYLDTCTYVWII